MSASADTAVAAAPRPPGPAPPPVPRRKRARAAGGEVLVAVAVAVAGLAVIRLVLGRAVPPAMQDAALGALASPWAACLLALAGAGYLVAGWRHARAATAVLTGLAAALLPLPLMVGLLGTDQPMGGVLVGDNSFRTEYVTRFAASPALHDYMFAGESPFYPPAWFWAAGRWAAVTGAPPWSVMQPATLATQVLSVLAAFALWRLTARPATALAATVASSVMIGQVSSDPTSPWYSPYSAFVAVVVVPWLVAAARYAAGRGATPTRSGVLVASGAVLALTYYLVFLIAVVALLCTVLPGLVRQAAVRRRLLLLLAGVAVLTAVFWVPLALDVFAGSPTQGTFFDPEFLDVDTGLQAGVPTALVTVVAAVLLVLTLRATASRALFILGASVVVYQVLSALLLAVAHQHLQPQRAATLLWAAVGAALPIGAEALRTTVQRWREGPFDLALRRQAAGVVAVLAFLPMLSVASDFATPLLTGDLVRSARPAFDPWAPDALAASITDAAGAPADALVVASDHPAVLITHPFWGFLPWSVHYAHPQAQVAARVQFLRLAAACPDAACFDSALAASGFGRIDALVLRPERGSTVVLDTQLPDFPRPQKVTIAFRRELFDPAAWTQREVAGYAVYVARR